MICGVVGRKGLFSHSNRAEVTLCGENFFCRLRYVGLPGLVGENSGVRIYGAWHLVGLVAPGGVPFCRVEYHL